MRTGGCDGGGEGSGDSGLGGGGGEGSGDSGLGGGGGEGSGLEAKNIGNHCGGMALRWDTRVVGKCEPGLAVPMMLPTRMLPCVI